MDVLQGLIDFFAHYGYAAAFSVLILCGFGLPIPEDVTLVAGGVISGLGHADVKTMTAVCFAGVMIGDSTMFLLGKVFGDRMLNWPFIKKFLTPERYAVIQEKFQKHGNSAMFVARFLPGLRSLMFMSAGITGRVSFLRFLILDGFAAIISVPVWVYLGYHGANNRDWLIQQIKHGQNALYVLLALIALAILIFVWKGRKKNNEIV